MKVETYSSVSPNFSDDKSHTHGTWKKYRFLDNSLKIMIQKVWDEDQTLYF